MSAGEPTTSSQAFTVAWYIRVMSVSHAPGAEWAWLCLPAEPRPPVVWSYAMRAKNAMRFASEADAVAFVLANAFEGFRHRIEAYARWPVGLRRLEGQ